MLRKIFSNSLFEPNPSQVSSSLPFC
uniref:Uncharacterized protein LOC105637874 isoform X1 n=1 Tax=Rhizophora mucronata TaxID=61149 RepID=A0A2P2IJ63_RHIMU